MARHPAPGAGTQVHIVAPRFDRPEVEILSLIHI